MDNEEKELLNNSNNYVIEHRKNVKKAFDILLPKLKCFDGLGETELNEISQNIEKHDLSKFNLDEAMPYSKYFWGELRDERVKEDFKVAVKLHKSRNPHHPEYWMDESGETNKMPLIHVVEMICDWWSFGLKQNIPTEIFNYYDKNKDRYKFSEELTQIIESLLSLVQESIVEINNLKNNENI